MIQASDNIQNAARMQSSKPVWKVMAIKRMKGNASEASQLSKEIHYHCEEIRILSIMCVQKLCVCIKKNVGWQGAFLNLIVEKKYTFNLMGYYTAFKVIETY